MAGPLRRSISDDVVDGVVALGADLIICRNAKAVLLLGLWPLKVGPVATQRLPLRLKLEVITGKFRVHPGPSELACKYR